MPAACAISLEDAKIAREAMKNAKNPHEYRRLEAVALRSEGKSNKEVADITKYHPKRVSQIVSLYCNEGLEAVAEDHRRGGNRRHLTPAEEEQFLEGFKEGSESGKLLTVSEIKKAYDEKIGVESATSTIYFMLERHGWRKLMPRSAHPKKAGDEAVEASKKLTPNTKSRWQFIENMGETSE